MCRGRYVDDRRPTRMKKEQGRLHSLCVGRRRLPWAPNRFPFIVAAASREVGVCASGCALLHSVAHMGWVVLIRGIASAERPRRVPFEAPRLVPLCTARTALRPICRAQLGAGEIGRREVAARRVIHLYATVRAARDVGARIVGVRQLVRQLAARDPRRRRTQENAVRLAAEGASTAVGAQRRVGASRLHTRQRIDATPADDRTSQCPHAPVRGHAGAQRRRSVSREHSRFGNSRRTLPHRGAGSRVVEEGAARARGVLGPRHRYNALRLAT
mmetsp:Transcript_43125/g.140277  ORF Transcript_43125/g.140277 Transcript_43125/m.140277 type:complete len:272 (-) Transcript_43125:2-817(-)